MKKPKEYVELFRSLRSEWKWLLQYVRRYRLQILLYIVIGVLGTLMGLGAGLASKYLIDAVVSHDSGVIGLSVALAVGMSLLQIVLSAATGRISAVVGSRVSSEIRSNIYAHIVNARWENIKAYHSGELLNRLEGDANAISGSVISFIPNVVTRLTQFLGCLAIVLYYDPTMAIFALISAPILVLISRFSTKMMRKFNEESRMMNGRVLASSQESIQNLQTIKAFSLTGSQTEHFKALLEEYRSLRLNYNRFSLLLGLGVSTLGLVVSFICYGWGVWRLWQGAITFGTMTLFLQISVQLTGAFSALVSLVPSVISIATAAGRIQEIVEQPMEQDLFREKTGRMLPATLKKGVTIRAKDLSYTYLDGEHPVLQQVNFEAGPGEIVAFVGPSGEGKTTILRLLLGIMEPTEGSLTLELPDGSLLPMCDSTRRLCTYVPQGSTVFSGTIADNLRMVCPEATEEMLAEALKTAEAWSFVRALPKGLETAMGERGANFSEGQIQRISIARALLRQAPVLIMDEATSALDAQTEERLLCNLMTSQGVRTCFLTTHRPSMLKYCTKVYRIDARGVVAVE